MVNDQIEIDWETDNYDNKLITGSWENYSVEIQQAANQFYLYIYYRSCPTSKFTKIADSSIHQTQKRAKQHATNIVDRHAFGDYQYLEIKSW